MEKIVLLFPKFMVMVEFWTDIWHSKSEIWKDVLFSVTWILYLLASNLTRGKLLKPMLASCVFDEEKDDSQKSWGQDIICFF